MIHIYHGDGKGKTTAACGLALRASGRGLRVLLAQFFKDGSSGEIAALSRLPNVTVLHPAVHYGRYKTLTEAERQAVKACYHEYLPEVLARSEDHDLVVLDEIVSAYNYNVIGRRTLIAFLKAQSRRREIVLTGRCPAPELLDLADYITEMRNQKHPFDRGIAAREGIEY